MKQASLYQNLEFAENKPAINVLFETNFTKEIRIVLRKGQEMKKHQTPYPIVVELVNGLLNFGVEGETLNLKKGDLLALEGGIPHNLNALEDSIVRLTLSKLDKAERVKEVINN